jgi:AcrR family transcriptional regulator
VPRTALAPFAVAAFRERLAVAATALFARHGYDAVTMRAVAARLGVSAMTPYRYVAGKDELVALVRAAAFRRFADHLTARSAGIDDPIDRLRQLKAAYLAFARAEPDAYRIMFELRAPDDVARWPAVAAEARRAFACLQDAVASAIARGALVGDALDVAQLLWASAHGLVALHLSGNLSARALARLADVDHELAGFLPPPRHPRSRS